MAKVMHQACAVRHIDLADAMALNMPLIRIMTMGLVDIPVDRINYARKVVSESVNHLFILI